MSIISLTEFKVFNKIPTDNTEYDIFFQSIIEYAQSQAENFCNREFLAKDYIEILDGDGTNILVLENFPINSVDYIKYYDGVDWKALIQGQDYNRLIIDDYKIILDGGIFAKGIKNYEIKYNAGYIETEIPKDIKFGLLELASIYFNESKQGDGTLIINNKNKGQVGLSENYDKEAELKILNQRFRKYRKINV